MNFFKKSSPLFISNAVNVILTLISAPILIKNYGVEIYGYYISMFVIVNVVNVIFNLQPWQALIQFWYRPEITTKRYLLIHCIKIDLISAIISSLIFLFTYKYIFHIFDLPIEYVNSFGYLFSFYLFFYQTSLFTGVLRCLSMYKEQAIFEVIESILKFIATIYFCYYQKNIGLYIVIFIFITALINLIRYVFTLGVLFNNKLFEHKSCKSMAVPGFLKYSLLINLKAIIDLPITHLDRLIVLFILGPNHAGIFDLMKKAGGLINFLIKPLSQVLLPNLTELVKNDHLAEALHFSLINSRRFIFGFSGIIICFYFIANFSPLLYFIGLEVLNPYISEISLYLLACALGASFVFIHILFMATGRIGEDVKVLFFANVAYLCAMYFLVDNVGLFGVGISLLAQSSFIIMYKLKKMKI